MEGVSVYQPRFVFCCDIFLILWIPTITSGLQTETPLLEIGFLKIRLDNNSKEVSTLNSGMEVY